MTYERGFKARCETIAVQVRKQLGLAAGEPLDADRLARYLGIALLTPHQVRGLSAASRAALLVHAPAGWSAVTVSAGASTIIITNPSHSAARRASDLMHELAHLLLKHEPSTFLFAPDGTWALRAYNGDQEEQATWLAGCLLLPRPALLQIARARLTDAEACQTYGVSRQLFSFRRNVSGVPRQLARRAAAARPGR